METGPHKFAVVSQHVEAFRYRSRRIRQALVVMGVLAHQPPVVPRIGIRNNHPVVDNLRPKKSIGHAGVPAAGTEAGTVSISGGYFGLPKGFSAGRKRVDHGGGIVVIVPRDDANVSGGGWIAHGRNRGAVVDEIHPLGAFRDHYLDVALAVCRERRTEVIQHKIVEILGRPNGGRVILRVIGLVLNRKRVEVDSVQALQALYVVGKIPGIVGVSTRQEASTDDRADGFHVRRRRPGGTPHFGSARNCKLHVANFAGAGFIDRCATPVLGNIRPQER